MKVLKTVQELRQILGKHKAEGRTVGLVPTMGFLHKGHLSLVERAKKENDLVVVSIFVNLTQFAPHEDFGSYPRDLERDKAMLEEFCDILFCPEQEEMYAENEHFSFAVKESTNCLCGVSRPQHFQGVALIVAKLFNVVRPDRAYFGQKDYQQAVLINQLIKDLLFDIELVVCPIVREEDGLAMSSRNIYLDPEERKQALILRKSLLSIAEMMKGGEKNVRILKSFVAGMVGSMSQAKLDYIDIREAGTLRQIENISTNQVVAALVVKFGKARLIDNIIFDPIKNEITG
jgi:pantoate--beta-alanine ligase